MDGLTLGHIAERNASKWPEREAVVERTGTGERESTATFEEFNDRADRLANALSMYGVEQGDAVGFYMKNNAATLEAFVGVMKLGALPVPINHRFKGEEVTYVLQDSEVAACLIDSFGAETMAQIHTDSRVPVETYLYVGADPPSFADAYEDAIAEADDAPVESVPTALDEAGIMYTSGTTGKPKGCIYTHSNVTSLAWDSCYRWDYLRLGNRHLVITPMFHVGGFVPFINNFHAGGTTVVVDGFEPDRALSLIEAESINSTFLVPTQARMLLDEDIDRYDTSSIEEFTVGGAPVGADLKRRLTDRFDCRISESFGQTEAMALVVPHDVAIEKADSVGQPNLSLEAKVLDPDTREERPTGEIGVIAYRGPTVFERYHNLPEKTEEVFEGEWFISGDLVREDEDGYFYFIGRSDDMIITGGENVYPAEIEDVLHGHPDIAEVAVVGVPDDTWGERIKACVTPAAPGLTEADVIGYVEERLADYKKPREVEFYDELPRNPTGKVLKSELT